jgi:subtilisin family serine protease
MQALASGTFEVGTSHSCPHLLGVAAVDRKMCSQFQFLVAQAAGRIASDASAQQSISWPVPVPVPQPKPKETNYLAFHFSFPNFLEVRL